jgi:alkyl sulfatase BDS1-like metallo-beta-lactamase superfamily hydrolase
MHDQTMRHANHGLTATEIAETMQLPAEFTAESHTVGYYGHLAHNVKAIYQRYLSWYDGNPAHLWMLPPVEAGRRYVALAGGAEALLAHARVAFDAGDYRWVAEVVNHLVFADPTNHDARELQADALEQLGYQSESATFRNAYLTGAQELRNGTLPPRPAHKFGLMAAMNVEQIIDSMAVRLRAEDAGGPPLVVNFDVTDVDEQWVVTISNRALHGVRGSRDGAPTATLTRSVLFQLAEGQRRLDEAIDDGSIVVRGEHRAIATLFDLLDTFFNNFAIVEP